MKEECCNYSSVCSIELIQQVYGPPGLRRRQLSGLVGQYCVFLSVFGTLSGTWVSSYIDAQILMPLSLNRLLLPLTNILCFTTFNIGCPTSASKRRCFYLRSFMSAVHCASTWAKGDWVDNPWSFFPCICMLWDVLSKGPEANLFRANSMAAKTRKAETGWRLRFLDGKIFQLVAFVSILGSASHYFNIEVLLIYQGCVCAAGVTCRIHLSQRKDVYHGKFKRLQRFPTPKKKVSTNLPTWKLSILFLVRTKSCIISYARNIWVVKILSIPGTTALRTAVGTSLWDRVRELVEDQKLLIRQDYW